jgi:hypothetical protein
MSARSRDFERRLLAETVRRAGVEYGIHCPAYPAAVARRLSLGAERYGDAAFLGRDNLRELREETPDIAGYALLELQARGGEQAPPRLFTALRRVLLHGALCDHHARVAGGEEL